MTKLDDMEKAVSTLAPRELAEFRSWFEAFEAGRFDAQIERDAVAGRLDGIAHQAIAGFRAGRTRTMTR